MTKINLGQALSTLANVGVIGGLVFVGLQLQQDREIAQIERRLAVSDSNKYWAELVTANLSTWTRGLAGEPLTEEETLVFTLLATTRQFDMFREWVNSRSSALDIDRELTPDLTRGFIREAALEIYAYPGFLEWHWQYNDVLQKLGRYGLFNELVDEEIRALEASAGESER